MHFCTVPNQKTWTVYSLFKTKPSNLFSLLVNVIAHLFSWTLYTGCPYENASYLRSVCMFSNVSREVHQNTSRTFFRANSNLLLDHSRDLQLIPLFSLLMLEKIVIGDKSFYVSAPSLWNSLPRNIREACTLSSFKKVLKSHLYPSYWLCFAVVYFIVLCFSWRFDHVWKGA